MVLNWSTDPKLLDKSPATYNNWETANSLISKKTAILQDFTFTNLYGILIRKIDFVRKKKRDRILARFPFLVLTDKMIEELQAKELLLAEATRDYFYRSINKSVLAWRDRINNFFERGAIPLPLYRVAEDMQLRIAVPPLQEHPLSLYTDQIPFTSARGEPFSIPKKISKKLAYLLGVTMGDGNLRKYWIIVVDQSKEHILFINELFEELFGKSGKMIKMGGAWATKLNLLWAVRLFNFLSDQPINKPKYDSLREPLIFKQLEEIFRALYWRGAFDADGSFKNQLVFSSMSKKFCLDFQKYLKEIKIESKHSLTEAGGHVVVIPAKDKGIFAQKIGTSHSKKALDFQKFLKRSYSYHIFQGFKENNLTKDGFFDFSIFPSLQVLGLANFFSKIAHREYSSISSKELKRYRKGHAITIEKILRLLDESSEKALMPFLEENKQTLHFSSSNSAPIKLPLTPSPLLETIMSKLIPTARGASLKEVSDELIFQIEALFRGQVINEKIKSKLLSRFLITFGIYKEVKTNTLDIEVLKKTWEKSIG
ncbi:MAG: hypothetical protein GF308_18015 [Candidatus Heimdallarchaeota archaeon]|nr:hypothetical protein [Candidatus Heimdallarchaeota archaeon]